MTKMTVAVVREPRLNIYQVPVLTEVMVAVTVQVELLGDLEETSLK